MKTMDHDLLTAPLFSWRDEQHRRARTTLPGLLAHLANGELADFPRLRTHQLNPWCMFLTQLAAVALHRSGQSNPERSETEWGVLLLALTNGCRESWCLTAANLSKPAFFQPPVPEGTTTGWSVYQYPDDLDILVTSKSHDVKTRLIHGADPESWAYALATLQTMQGYPGRGYYGVARMKGGYGNRPRVGIAPDLTLSQRFVRDVSVLLDGWPSLIDRGYADEGVALVWTQAWDGRESLAMSQLSPHFVEVCWRVRCQAIDGRLTCLYTTTNARRCLPEQENGDVGDPWIPIARADAGALTVGPAGLNYRLLERFLFEGDFEPAPAQRLRESDGDPMVFFAWALARGQGKTEGLHERALSIKGRARLTLGHPDMRAALGRRAAARVDAAAKMSKNVLYPALRQLTLDDKPASNDFDARVDEMFFDHLFDTLAMTDDEARLAFDARLRDIARAELATAIARAGLPSARRYRVISAAERVLHLGLLKNFADLMDAGNPAGEPS